MTTPGGLNRRLVLEAPSEADDGAGGVTRSYVVVTKLWAQVVPRSAVGTTAADRVAAVVRYRIIVRARSDITIKHRLQDSTHIYGIIAVRPSADRRFIEIEAEERDE